MNWRRISVAVAVAFVTPACNEPNGPSSTTATVRIVFMGATARRSDLPASAQACIDGVAPTHPSWRAFVGISLQSVPRNRYEITFMDVPVNTQVSFRVNDQNFCDENPTGAVTQNIFVNGIRLV